ncbi:MAG: nicotinate-nucleotide adenylyltransferase [Prochloron sp. SP5CPC1]|nr:nicotinate-nucleotide adenylyltransferase [Candidatus Paraprochloron terpiosi SP5CPC1]
MKIALFGTSADPPTTAHQGILNWLCSHYQIVAVWAADNPLKGEQTPLEHRTAMLQLAIADLEKPNLQLWKELSDRRTLITIQKAMSIWGIESDYTLVIGADLVQQISHWYESEILLQLVQLLIIPRQGYILAQEDLKILSHQGVKWAIPHLQTPAVSSTAYREGRLEGVIAPSVRDYIQRNHLYL